MKLLIEGWRQYLKEHTSGGELVARIFSLDRPPEEGMDEATWARRAEITLPDDEKISILEIFDELNEEPDGEWEGWKNNITDPLERLKFMDEAIRESIEDWAEMKGLDVQFKDA